MERNNMPNLFDKFKTSCDYWINCNRKVQDQIDFYISKYNTKLAWHSKKGRMVTIQYIDRENNETEIAVIVKAVLEEAPSNVYVIAFCVNHNDVRVLKTDSITSIIENNILLDKKEFLKSVGVKNVLDAYL